MLIILYSVEAVEYDELDTFLRLKESWNPNYDDTPKLEVVPIGVPGASSPSQMTNHKPYVATSPSPSPLKDNTKKGKEHDAGLLLEDRVLEGIQVTDTELEDLVKELGLEGDEAGDLVKGLSFSSDREPVTPLAHKTALPAEDHILSNPVKELDPVASTEDIRPSTDGETALLRSVVTVPQGPFTRLLPATTKSTSAAPDFGSPTSPPSPFRSTSGADLFLPLPFLLRSSSYQRRHTHSTLTVGFVSLFILLRFPPT